MSAERSSDVKFEIGHVLFIDIVIFPVVFAMHLSRSLRSRESAHVVRKRAEARFALVARDLRQPKSRWSLA
jgi:hypothetical protein